MESAKSALSPLMFQLQKEQFLNGLICAHLCSFIRKYRITAPLPPQACSWEREFHNLVLQAELYCFLTQNVHSQEARNDAML